MKHDIYAKGLRFLWHAISSKNNPLLAQLVVTRRCNLSCAYCNEYDNFSAPIPFDALKSRITKLARLNTFAITLTGGEPMLHPDIDRIIRYINSLGLVSTIITNGYLLTKDRIELLNEAGLHEL
ncbi:MAG: radical SAM protein, partial [Calditrichia bacterium]